MTGVLCTLVGSRGSPYAGDAFVTVGFLTDGTFSSYGYGFSQGNIFPSTWAGSGLAFSTLKDVYSSGSPAWLDFTVAGEAPNSGWSTMNVNGTILNRVDASYYASSGSTSWIWFGAPTAFGTTVGAGRLVTWS